MIEVSKGENTNINETEIETNDSEMVADHIGVEQHDNDDSTELEEIVLNEQARNAIKSWFEIGNHSRRLIWCYAGMTLSAIIFAILNAGAEGNWFWPKVVLMILVSAGMSFMATVIRLLVYSGKPSPNLRDDLLDVSDAEKIVTANNFYLIIVKALLIPTTTVLLAQIATQIQVLSESFKGDISEFSAGLMLVFLTLALANTLSLVYLYIYLKRVKKGNKEIENELQKIYESNQV